MQNKALKNSIQACEEVKAVLSVFDIESVITGGIYTASRPLGNTKEDIVINSVYFDADQVQTGFLNINIHVPNMNNQAVGNPTAIDNTQPNVSRYKEIAAIVVTVIEGDISKDFSISLRDSGELEGYKNDWYFNIGVEYEFLRTDLK